MQHCTTDVAAIRLFGSRLNDQAVGGDVDLLVEFNNPVPTPALLAARIATCAMRVLNGRKVDVLIAAPNLQMSAIHHTALKEGQLL
ncbi:nucleotidyltransferase domain-containing protein [Thiospirillum jenense]|uniref:Nucleotidyltransferase domain-containing protein n=1 Tax=Thiospirillum jenense TaxID=1653858 RepID=A0A839HDL2_9GAMM|nr:nucleotidyltransferase domain-containing protein [Thiospirillum jenense]